MILETNDFTNDNDFIRGLAAVNVDLLLGVHVRTAQMPKNRSATIVKVKLLKFIKNKYNYETAKWEPDVSCKESCFYIELSEILQTSNGGIKSQLLFHEKDCWFFGPHPAKLKVVGFGNYIYDIQGDFRNAKRRSKGKLRKANVNRLLNGRSLIEIPPAERAALTP